MYCKRAQECSLSILIYGCSGRFCGLYHYYFFLLGVEFSGLVAYTLRYTLGSFLGFFFCLLSVWLFGASSVLLGFFVLKGLWLLNLICWWFEFVLVPVRTEWESRSKMNVYVALHRRREEKTSFKWIPLNSHIPKNANYLNSAINLSCHEGLMLQMAKIRPLVPLRYDIHLIT